MNEQMKKVLFKYCDVKGISVDELTRSDYGRFGKRINQLLERGDAVEVCRMLDVIDEKFEGLTWTLETLDKRWLELRANKKKQDRFQIDGAEFDRKLKEWQTSDKNNQKIINS